MLRIDYLIVGVVWIYCTIQVFPWPVAWKLAKKAFWFALGLIGLYILARMGMIQ